MHCDPTVSRDVIHAHVIGEDVVGDRLDVVVSTAVDEEIAVLEEEAVVEVARDRGLALGRDLVEARLEAIMGTFDFYEE